MEKLDEILPDQINIPINQDNNIDASNEHNSLLNEENNKKSEEINTKPTNIRQKGKNHGNIGKNVVLFNKYVFGPINTLWMVITSGLGIIIAFYLWIIFMGNFYPKILYIIFHIPFLLDLIFLTLCYITEPGIIPRSCPNFSQFQKENENLEINNKNENETNKKMPRIFTERKCETCNIIRCPGSSHCSTCDNCVQGFDHHCVFISNCVGKRNHKYFYLFLFFGSFLSIVVIILNLIVIINVFIINSDLTIGLFYKKNKLILFISLSLLLIGILSSFNRFPRFDLIFTFGIAGFGLFLYLWYKYFKKNETQSYYNPYIIVTFLTVVLMGIPITINFIGQSYHISKGYTVKQLSSIKDKIGEFSRDSEDRVEIVSKYLRKLSCGEKMKNIISFLFMKKDKSLIIPERDLININN